MVARYVLDSDKLLISQPGFDVDDPSLLDENKIFDSRWIFTSFLLASGYYAGLESFSQYSTFATTHYFPDLGQTPTITIERTAAAFTPDPFFNTTEIERQMTTQNVSGHPNQQGTFQQYGQEWLKIQHFPHNRTYDLDTIYSPGGLVRDMQVYSNRFELTWGIPPGSQATGHPINTNPFTWAAYALAA